MQVQIRVVCFLLCWTFSLLAKVPLFVPPENWELLDPTSLPPCVKVSFSGKSSKSYPPSINLAQEEIKCSAVEYVKIVKKIQVENPTHRLRDLGKIKTRSGEGRLLEIQQPTSDGPMRLLQLIFIDNQTAYILTAASLKEEFPKYTHDFQKALESFSLTSDLLSEVDDPLLQKTVSQEKEKLLAKRVTQEEFLSPTFQTKVWLPFQTQFLKQSAVMGSYWQLLLLQEIAQQVVTKP